MLGLYATGRDGRMPKGIRRSPVAVEWISLDTVADFDDNRRRMSPQLTSQAIELATTPDAARRCTSMAYPGGKGAAGVHQRVINQIPSHKLYIEPFLGAGN